MKLISKPLVPLMTPPTLAGRITLRLLNELRLIYRKQLRQGILRELPVFEVEPPCQSGIHMLVCRRDFEMAMISAMMMNVLGGKGHCFIFHDDGSLDDDLEKRLYQSLPGSKIIRRKTADKILKKDLSEYPAMLEFRRKQVLALKLIDIPFFSEYERIGYIDADILFFQYPAAFSRQLNDSADLNIFNKDISNAYITDRVLIEEKSGVKLPKRINSGLWVMNRKVFDFGMIESWLKNPFLLPYLADYRLEQTIMAMLAGSSEAETIYFPEGYDVSFEKLPEASICKHYVGRIRYGYELEGLRYISNNKKYTH